MAISGGMSTANISLTNEAFDCSTSDQNSVRLKGHCERTSGINRGGGIWCRFLFDHRSAVEEHWSQLACCRALSLCVRV